MTEKETKQITVELTKNQCLLLDTIANITKETREQALFLILKDALPLKIKRELKKERGFLTGWNPYGKDAIIESEMFDDAMKEMEGR